MTSPEPENPLSHPQVRALDTGRYIIGFVVSVALMTASFLAVTNRIWGPAELYGVLSVLAGFAVIAQLLLWLQLDGSSPQRWLTIAFVLYIPLFLLTVGLTSWMFATLYTRTMMPQIMPWPG